MTKLPFFSDFSQVQNATTEQIIGLYIVISIFYICKISFVVSLHVSSVWPGLSTVEHLVTLPRPLQKSFLPF